jgi:hypothetical protein
MSKTRRLGAVGSSGWFDGVSVLCNFLLTTWPANRAATAQATSTDEPTTANTTARFRGVQ